MKKTSIPERLPISDLFTGAVVEREGKFALVSRSCDDETALFTGEMTIRYGIRYLGKPHIAIVPGLVVVDYGTMLNGEAAWQFVTKKSNLYPRAEVFGFRNDGKDEMIVIKALDLALPPAVLVYTDINAVCPLAQVSALIMPTTDHLNTTERLTNALPRFDTIKDWLALRA